MTAASKALTAIVTAGVLVMTAGGCGGPSKAAQEKAAAAKERKEQAAAQAAEEKRQQRERREQHDHCAAALEDFTSALSEIDSRLSVGLNYAEYGDRLGDAQVAYDRIDIEGLQEISPACLSAAVPLENAYNDYLDVLQLWGDCIDDYDCDFSEGETNRKAQNGWNRAGKALEKSETKLGAMTPS